MANFKKKRHPNKKHSTSTAFHKSPEVRNEVRSQRRKAHALLGSIIDIMDDDVELKIKEIRHNVNRYS